MPPTPTRIRGVHNGLGVGRLLEGRSVVVDVIHVDDHAARRRPGWNALVRCYDDQVVLCLLFTVQRPGGDDFTRAGQDGKSIAFTVLQVVPDVDRSAVVHLESSRTKIWTRTSTGGRDNKHRQPNF